MKDCQEVRDHLITMLQELNERLGKITDDVKHTDSPLDKDFSEQAIEAENDEVLDALGNASRLEVEMIKQAISRIDAGTYGKCQICGEPINPERLTALPFVGCCIGCASQKEHQDKIA